MIANRSRSTGRSIGAIVAGLLTTALLALMVDLILHAVGVFPPWGQPYFGAGPYLLAVGYRSVFNVVGFLVAGPTWYPVALSLMTFPSAALARALMRRSSIPAQAW
ncbi:MAG: hypothetical protein ACJ8F1_14235 [Polyangia bacterium]